MHLRHNKKTSTTSLRWNEIPPGSFIETEHGYFYVVSTERRYKATPRVLQSWSPQRIIGCSETEPAVKRLKVAAKLKFRNGSLLYSQSTGKMYLVSDNKLRHITNPDILVLLGVRRQDAVWVSQDEINLHEVGMELNG